MKKLAVLVLTLVGVVVGGLAVERSPLVAQRAAIHFSARLDGYQEVPAISTTGQGVFDVHLAGETALDFVLRYQDLTAPVTVAHIHLGQPGAAGGVIAFLCGGGGKADCPASGTVTGRITATDMVGPVAQGITPEEFTEVVRALRAGVVYANVHSTLFPAGELRGQVHSFASRTSAEP